MTGLLRLALGGDLMIGRGIDQIMPDSVDPELHEPHVADARSYVRIAEEQSGPIPREADPAYPWGAAIETLGRFRPDLRIVNLETSLTRSSAFDPGKHIHYRADPRNVRMLTRAGVDCAILANNHVMDWGETGLADTLRVLDEAGIAHVGAGRSAQEAHAPAALHPRVLVFGAVTEDAGAPRSWSAEGNGSGVFHLGRLDADALRTVVEHVRARRRPNDRVIVSLHWGGNWGYRIPEAQRRFARGLIDTGLVDLVFGHSAHHRKAIEVYRDRLILYGAGDLLNDYEGIGGSESYRDDLTLLYFPVLEAETGRLRSLTMAPFRVERFRLESASVEEAAWLAEVLTREGEPFATRVLRSEEHTLVLDW